jgi:hypothetical protein
MTCIAMRSGRFFLENTQVEKPWKREKKLRLGTVAGLH